MHSPSITPEAAATPTPRYLSVKEAARRIGVSPSYLNRARTTGCGPEFCKVGARVIYADAAIDTWMASRRRRSTSDLGGTSARPTEAR